MKKSFSKRLLALFLAVLMLATMLPFNGLTTFAKQASSQSGGYLFAYFKDNKEQQKLYLALSRDGYTFEELNAMEPIPLDYSNTVSGYIRDPFIFKAQDNDPNGYKYYVIATDMDANNWENTARQHAVNLWGAKELKDGFEHVSNIDMDSRFEGSLGKLMADKYGDKSCSRFWAPEVIWDPTYITDETPNGAYMISFGFAFEDWSRGTRLYYTHTLDFIKFFDVDPLLELKDSSAEDPNRLIDSIDSDIIEFKGDYYMFFKNEEETRVYVTKSKTGKPSGPYYDDLTADSANLYQVSRNDLLFEGPAAYQIDGTDTYLVALDNFTNNEGYYYLYQTGDFKNFTPVPSNEYQMCAENKARHASVCHISDQEYNDLIAKYGKYTDSQTGFAGEDINQHLVARYLVDTDPAKDVSGNGNDIINGVNGEFANLEGKTVVKDGKLCLDFTSNVNTVNGTKYKPTSNDIDPSLWVKNTEPWCNYVVGEQRRLVSRNYGTYLSFETADLLKNTDINQGVSISFDAMTQGDGNIHVIDISNAQELGYINANSRYIYNEGAAGVGSINTANHPLSNNKAAYNNANNMFIQMTNASYAEIGYLHNGSEPSKTRVNANTTEWHNYTITVTKGMLTVYVDGVKVQQVKDSLYNAEWFDTMFKSTEIDDSKLIGKSKIGLGVSHWLADYLFDGYISNFCLYDRCLSLNDIAESQAQFSQGDTIPMSESRLIYQDLVTEEQFAKYDTVVSDTMTNGYGKMLRVNSATIDSAETVEDCETTVSPSGYSYNFWVYPNESIENAILLRHGSDQYHFDIREDGIVEFRYGDDISFISNKLFDLNPNKVQNVSIEVVPYASYDRIVAYVDGEQTGYYDAYLAAADNNYPEKTLLSFINDTNASVKYNTQVRYGDASVNSTVTGVTIHRGAVDGKELYLSKFSDLAESIYLYEFKEFEAKIAEFNTTDKLYKNMNNAYVAYDKISRYVDAVEYGKQDADINYLAELVTELKLANDEMVPYTANQSLYTDYNVRFSNGTEQITDGVSNGVLYADVYTADSGSTNDTKIMTGGKDDVLFNILYDNTVFIYDGKNNNLRMPIALYAYRDQNTSGTFNKKYRYVNSAYPVTADSTSTDPKTYDAFYIGAGDVNQFGAWSGYNTSFVYNINDSTEIGWDTLNSNNRSTGDLGAKNKNYWYNCLNIKADQLVNVPDSNGNTGSIQGEYNLTWHAYGSSDKKNLQWSSIDHANDSVIIKQPKSIFVLDVTGLDVENENCPLNVKDPTNAVHGVVPNSSNMVISSEIASNLLKAIDMYTSFDNALNEELVKDNVASALYENLKNDINNAASNYDEAYSEAAKALHSFSGYKDADYDNLKAELKDDAYLAKIDNIKNNQTIDGTEKYTIDSCEAYVSVYDEAVNHFASLDPRNADGGQSYATEDGNVSDTATNLYNDILEADSKLMPVADYDKITKDYNDSMALSLGDPVGNDNTINQNYSVKSWLGLAEPQEAAAQYVNEEQAVKNNTPKFATLDNGVVDRDTPSVVQLEITDADDALMAAVNALEAPADGDVLETYNAAQRLAERVDLDAYTSDARQPILDNFNLGYYSADNTIKNAQAPAEGSVYVDYNGDVYIYGGATDTENATKTVLEALNVTYIESSGTPVKVGGYEVTVNVFIDGSETPVVLPISTHLYGSDTGSKVRIDAGAYNNGTYDVAKWTIQSQKASAATLINQTGFVIDRVIQQDTTVNLYLTTKVEGASKVVVTDCFGVQLDVAYVNGAFAMTSAATDAKLTFTDASGRIHEIDATQTNGFTFTKWDVIKTADAVKVVQRAEKVNNEQYALYKVQGGTVNGNDGTAGVYVDFNEYVSFVSTTDNFFAWVKSLNGTDWYVASYDANFRTISAPTDANGITYRAVTADEFKTLGINGEIANEALAVKSPFSFGTAVELVNVGGADKFRLYCDFSVNSNMNENVEVVQCGVLYTAADIEPENFIKGADGIRTGAANAYSDCNTYTMTLSPKPGSNTYMRSYVSYMYTKTNADGSTTKVPLVAYGPVVTCDANGNISR